MSRVKKLEPNYQPIYFKAIEFEKAGLKVDTKKTSDFDVPGEFIAKFGENPEFRSAFENLTPARQKAYFLYFSQAKQSKTRASRIEQYNPRIMNGKGIKDCLCGHSKRYPNCDGSHKNFSA